MKAQLESLARNVDGVTLRKIDLSSRRDMTAAQQHGVRGIPHLVLFEGDRQVAAGTGEVMARLGY